jgi:copper transport protein
MLQRALFGLFLALLLGAAHTGPAAAHAVLVSADPPDHAVLARAPAQLRLDFDEPVTLTELRLVGPDGKPVAVQPQAIDTEVSAAIPGSLAPGIYTVSYRVISADGHVVVGALQFGFGIAAGHWSASSSGISALRWWLAGCAWIAMLGGFLSFGLPLLGLPQSGAVASPRDRRLGDAAALMAGLASIVALGFQGLAMTGAPWKGLRDPHIWLAGAGTATAQFAAMLTLGLLLQRISLRAAPRLRAPLLAGAAALVILAYATTGHVYAIGAAASAALAIHVACALFWVSALLPLLARLRDAEPAEAMRRFSQLALPAVIVLVLAGAVIACLQVQHLNEMTTTAYGMALTAKLILVALALGCAAVNRWVLTPAIDRGDAGALRRAFVSIRVELVLLAGILALTAALGQLTPPRHLLAAEHAAPQPVAMDRMAMDRGAMVMATMTMNASGAATLVTEFSDPNSQPVEVKQAVAEFTNLDTGTGPLRASLTPDGGGLCHVDGIHLVPRGHWRITVKADYSDFDRRIFTLNLRN